MAFDRDQAEKVAAAFAGHIGRGWIRANCPLCVEDHKISMGLNTSTGGYNCFKCQTTGWLPPEFRDWEALDPPEVAPIERSVIQMPEGFVHIYEEPGWSAGLFDRARDYMERRKISASTCAAAGIGAVTRGWLVGRVIIPIVEDNICRGWVARDYTGTADRPYMYPKGMTRMGCLYNAETLRDELDEPALIVEGCFDALPYWPDAAACLGKPLESHLPLILAAKRPVVVCLDGDAWEEGWSFALKARHLGARVGSVKLPAGEDPGSIDPDWLRGKARQVAQDLK